jgi:hypothetical protein
VDGPHLTPTPPHPTTEEVSDMNQECQPKGKTEKKRKELVHIPEVSRTDKCRKQPMSFEFHAFDSKGLHHLIIIIKTPSKFVTC